MAFIFVLCALTTNLPKFFSSNLASSPSGIFLCTGNYCVPGLSGPGLGFPSEERGHCCAAPGATGARASAMTTVKPERHAS